MANKLEEYKQGEINKAYIPSFGAPYSTEDYAAASGFEKGFDTAVALDLPVKFYKWYMSINKMGHETRVKIVKELNMDKYPEIEDFYEYWIENIYKLE